MNDKFKKTETNYSFIDGQNLNLGVKELGWILDWRRFRVYLKDKYKVDRAYIFLGYLSENQDLYNSLQSYGYILVFKPVMKNGEGEVKGNVDAELVLQSMIDLEDYDKAVIVSSDGDFHCLVKYLYKKNKLKQVISPCKKYCSVLLQKSAKEKIVYLDNLKKKLSYKKKKHRSRTNP